MANLFIKSPMKGFTNIIGSNIFIRYSIKIIELLLWTIFLKNNIKIFEYNYIKF